MHCSIYMDLFPCCPAFRNNFYTRTLHLHPECLYTNGDNKNKIFYLEGVDKKWPKLKSYTYKTFFNVPTAQRCILLAIKVGFCQFGRSSNDPRFSDYEEWKIFHVFVPFIKYFRQFLQLPWDFSLQLLNCVRRLTIYNIFHLCSW